MQAQLNTPAPFNEQTPLFTPLQQACLMQLDSSFLEQLLESGADPNVLTEEGHSAVHLLLGLQNHEHFHRELFREHVELLLRFGFQSQHLKSVRHQTQGNGKVRFFRVWPWYRDLAHK